MQFYLFNILPELHHQKWRKLRVTLLSTKETWTRYFQYAVWETITW